MGNHCSGLEESEQLAAVSLDTELIHNQESRNALQAARQLLDSSELTEVQRRRFIQHFFEGLSYRQIAKQEDVFFTSVAESVGAAARKLKKFLKKFNSIPVHPPCFMTLGERQFFKAAFHLILDK